MAQETSSKKKFYNSITLRWRPNFLGGIFALVFLLFSLLPSLLPRTWLIQGVVSGFSMAIGYGLGLATSVSIRWLFRKEFSANVKWWAWKIFYIAGPILTLLLLFLGRQWQNDVRVLIGSPTMGPADSFRVVLATTAFFALGLSIGKGTRRMYRRAKKIFNHFVPPRVGVALATIVAAALVYFIASGLIFNGFVSGANALFSAKENNIPPGVSQPTTKYRSGSKESLVPWDKLGYQGKQFLGRGPTVAQLEKYSGKKAPEPIRIYAGLKSGDTPEDRADVAVKELERTHAFDRKVLVIATTTGSGWLEPTAMDSLEFLYNGDTAIVAQQYSYLPSWITFLTAKEDARDAGRALYDAVIDEWLQLPADARPKLLVYGLSLGSFGGQAAYSGINDLRRSVDGAVFTGTPNDTELWEQVTKDRDKGSPQWQPTYKGGETVRFASTPDDITKDQSNWKGTRLLYLQHANDGVVWYSADLIFHKPDWLKEKRGPNVSSATRWYPFVTYLQVGLDQAVAGNTPPGEGHTYTDIMAYAWAGVLPPQGWTNKDTEKLQHFLNISYTSDRLK